MKKIIRIAMSVVTLCIFFAACSDKDKDEPQGGSSSNWFAGKEFTAEVTYDHPNWEKVDWYVMSMDGNGGVGYDGRFKITPYIDPYEDGVSQSVVTNCKSYTGKYQVDWENFRIFVTYDGYSANAVWYFEDEDYQGWPFYKPNRMIRIPADALGELAGLNFYSGNVFEGQKWDNEHDAEP